MVERKNKLKEQAYLFTRIWFAVHCIVPQPTKTSNGCLRWSKKGNRIPQGDIMGITENRKLKM